MILSPVQHTFKHIQSGDWMRKVCKKTQRYQCVIGPHIKKLVDIGYVTVERVDRRKIITLTAKGIKNQDLLLQLT